MAGHQNYYRRTVEAWHCPLKLANRASGEFSTSSCMDHAPSASILTDASSIHMVLSNWNPTTTPVMDLRPLDSYLQGPRLSGAAYVPSHDIASHCFWLPDKEHPFAVVMPAHGNLPVQECPSLPAFLLSRNWTQVAFYVRDCQALWDTAQELGLLDQPAVEQHALLQRFMFRPCPLLLEEISRIEACLLADAHAEAAVNGAVRQQTERQDASLAHSSQQSLPKIHAQQEGQQVKQQQEQQQQLLLPTRPNTFRCLEPGCGAGRNIIWLAARHIHSNQTSNISTVHTHGSNAVVGARAGTAPCWSVLGIDNWYASLVRTQDLCQACHMPREIANFWYASISPETGLLGTLPRPSASSKHGAQQLTHIQLDGAMQLGQGCWQLILCVRFLERAFLQHIPALLAPGGFLLYCTFLDMEGTRRFGRPKGNNHLLQRHELAALFGDAQGFDIIRDDVALCRDGRELSMFVARKKTMGMHAPHV